MKNIEQSIYRQRLIMEARYSVKVTKDIVRSYLLDLAKELDMTLHLPEPIITSATGKSKPIHDGYEGVIFWVESGAVIYVWERVNFLTVDIYSCKPFDNPKAIDFTVKYFGITKIEYTVI